MFEGKRGCVSGVPGVRGCLHPLEVLGCEGCSPGRWGPLLVPLGPSSLPGALMGAGEQTGMALGAPSQLGSQGGKRRGA